MATLKESLTYNPVELKFGTSGLRGLVTEMTDLECYINIQGFLKFLSDNEGLEKGETVVIAGDLRDSTPRIMRTAAQAISDAGYIVSNQGFIPTPAAAYYAQKLNILCIMVTGSHIPADRNGIKFYKKSGELLKSDETNVINAVASVRDITYSTDSEQSIFSVDGSLRHADELNGPTDDAMTLYKNRYLDFFDNNVLAGQNIVFYQHSAVGRDLLVDILQALGASVQVICTNRYRKHHT
jgi:phosphomannomutase